MVRNRQKLGMVVLLILCWWANPGTVDAGVMVEMHTATGAITNISDNIITLEGERLFYPLKTSVSPSLNTGMIVTIMYYMEPDGTSHYTEVALGENALSAPPPMGGKALESPHLK